MKNTLKKLTIILLFLFLILPLSVYANTENIDKITSVNDLKNNKNKENEKGEIKEDQEEKDSIDAIDSNVEENSSILDEGETTNTNIKVSLTLKDNGSVLLTWNKINKSFYYKVYRTDKDGNLLEITFTKENYYEFKNLEIGKSYKFLVKAYSYTDDNYTLIDKSVITNEIKPIKLVPFNSYNIISNKTIKKPIKLDINIREMLNESSSGYSTIQGACADKDYIYYLIISKKNDKGRILKVNKNNLLPVSRSKVLNIIHGNGMACNSRENKLLIVGKDNRSNQISIVDSNSLKLIKYQNINYANESNISGAKVKSKKNRYYGVAAITYNERYDVYFALLREKHNILILNKNLKLIGFIKPNINTNYPGLYQAMDSDNEHLYLTLSPYNKTQNKNIVLVINYEANNIISMINTGKNIISSSYSTSAPKVIKINNLQEIENIYHIDNTFYVSEYKTTPVYHYVTHKVKYKVKKKKVWRWVKYKKIKYKKVLVKDKGKYVYKKKKIVKYKHKWKKVWKYKTKYKKKKVYEFYYTKRDGNVYDIGSI